MSVPELVVGSRLYLRREEGGGGAAENAAGNERNAVSVCCGCQVSLLRLGGHVHVQDALGSKTLALAVLLAWCQG
jgi:hypothetical protein